MCGICGWAGPTPPPDEELPRMAARLIHRGPDQDGFHLAQEVGLAIRRLKIIDLEGGHQPLGNADGSIQVVVNGEIYNFQGIREELLAEGFRFRTNSDSEVVAHGWERWGEGLFERIDGMFALAIWDGDNCEGDPVETVPLGDDTPCTALPELPANAHVAAAPIPVEGDCIAQLNEVSVPPSFGAHAELCGPSSEPAACGDGGQCVPADANVCIWRPGDSPCPEGVYSEQLLAYGGYDLFQECSCDCGQPSCAGTINLEDGSCNEVLEVDGGSCEPLPANASNASFVAGDPADACGPGVVTQVGGATPLDQITVCCMP